MGLNAPLVRENPSRRRGRHDGLYTRPCTYHRHQWMQHEPCWRICRTRPAHLVGHRLSSDRRTAFDWALGMFDTTRHYFDVVPRQSIPVRTGLIGKESVRPRFPPILCCSENPSTMFGFVNEVPKYITVHWPRLIEATAGPAVKLKTLWDHSRNSGRPEKFRV